MNTKKIEKYLESGGAFCPHCGGENLESAPMEFDGYVAYVPSSCDDCGTEWTDTYRLTEVEVSRVGTKNLGAVIDTHENEYRRLTDMPVLDADALSHDDALEVRSVIMSCMSPENIFMDGEIGRDEANKRRKFYLLALEELNARYPHTIITTGR